MTNEIGVILAKVSGAGVVGGFLITNMPILQAFSLIIGCIAGITAIMVNQKKLRK